MPWIETEIYEDFINFIKNFDRDFKYKILNLLGKYKESI